MNAESKVEASTTIGNFGHTHADRKEFVVIDDDITFCLSMVYAARRRGFGIDYYTSLMDMGSIGRFERYDVAIVDLNLEHMSGLEVAEYFPVFFNSMPILLISGSHQIPSGHWPKSIRGFLHKSSGFDTIINTAAWLRVGRQSGGQDLF